jgi:hypothetical protein
LGKKSRVGSRGSDASPSTVRAWFARGQTWWGTGWTPPGPSDPGMYGRGEGGRCGRREHVPVTSWMLESPDLYRSGQNSSPPVTSLLAWGEKL